MGTESGRTQPWSSPLTDPYWSGCREGKLRLQQCDACERYQFYPRLFCSHCGHRHLSWREVSGRGRIASFTVVHHPISDAYPAPVTIVLVDLEEGPRLMSSLVDADPGRVSVGDRVSVEFEDWSEEFSLPVFRVIEEENAS